MKKVVKGKYIDGAVRLLEDYSLNENADVYIIIEEKEEKNLLEETFGIWIDEPEYLEKLREAGEDRIKRLGSN
jgi:hypothetical protein